jgi:hypothetical protein
LEEHCKFKNQPQSLFSVNLSALLSSSVFNALFSTYLLTEKSLRGPSESLVNQKIKQFKWVFPFWELADNFGVFSSSLGLGGGSSSHSFLPGKLHSFLSLLSHTWAFPLVSTRRL